MKYLKTVFIFVLLLFTYQQAALAQEKKAVSLLVLDNYTVPVGVKGAKIGTFVSGDNLPIVLIDDPSDLFEITKKMS